MPIKKPRLFASFLIFLFSLIYLVIFQNFVHPSSLPNEVDGNMGNQPTPVQLLSLMPVSTIEGQNVLEIRSTVFIDKSITVDKIHIYPEGKLVCDESASPDVDINITITAKSILVEGLLQCGRPNFRYNKNITFQLAHADLKPSTVADDYLFSQNKNVLREESQKYRSLIVTGTLILHGNFRRAGLLKLADNANIGDSQIKLVNVSASNNWTQTWKPGDLIAIGPTSFNYEEAEEFYIQSIDASTNTIRIRNHDGTPAQIKHFHIGLIETYTDSKGVVKLDQRAEVINLTRNIVIKSHEPTNQSFLDSEALGGHVMIHMANAKAFIDSVEFYKLGQAGIMGKYPIHWHMVQNINKQYIVNSSIHHSFQRCVVIHRTSNLSVYNNNCFNFKGHGFFLEDGNEVDNVIENNIAMLADKPVRGRVLLASEDWYTVNENTSGKAVGLKETGNQERRFMPVSSFWIAHPRNIVKNNISSGSIGVGFWMSFVEFASEWMPGDNPNFPGLDNYGTYVKDSTQFLSTPQNSITTEFNNNTAHSGLVGITWDGAPVRNEAEMPTGNPNNPKDRVLDSAPYSPNNSIPVFSDLIAFKNAQSGIYFRGSSAVYNRNLLADNGWHYFVASNQKIVDTVLIGKSYNYGNHEISFFNEGDGALRKPELQSGVTLYDGPFQLDKVRFINYSTEQEFVTINSKEYNVSTIPFTATVGTFKFTNLTNQLSFSPEPYKRILMMGQQDADETSNYIALEYKKSANLVRDLDGTLTGVPGGGLIVADNPLNRRDCNTNINYLSGFLFCPDPSLKIGTFTFFARYDISTNVGPNVDQKIPFITRRDSDGAISIPKNEWTTFLESISELYGGRKYDKISLPDNGNDQYTLLFKNLMKTKTGESTSIQHLYLRRYNTETGPGSQSPLVKIIGMGNNCQLTSTATVLPATHPNYQNQLKFIPKQVTTLDALKSETRTSYLKIENGLVAKFVTNDYIPTLKNINYDPDNIILSNESFNNDPSTVMDLDKVKIVCTEDTVNKYKVNFSNSIAWTSQGLTFNGYACQYGKSNSLNVNFYTQDSTLLSYALPSVLANSNSNADVNFDCGIAADTHHNFSFTAPLSLWVNKQNQTITAKAVDPTTGSETLTTNLEGVSLKIPTIEKVKGSYTFDGKKITGWACQPKYFGNITYKVFVDGNATPIKTGVAESSNEQNVSTACGTFWVGHRFAYTIPESIRSSNKGKLIRVQGISPADQFVADTYNSFLTSGNAAQKIVYP